MSEWSLVYDHYDPKEQGLREALCATGNGYFCTRGAFPWVKAGDVHYPGTYVAGGYNRLTSQVDGHEVENEDLVNFPNWTCLTFRIDGGAWFNLDDVEVLSFEQALDMREGILKHAIRFRHDETRETTLTMRRFVHMGWPHHAAQEMTVVAQNWSGTIEFRSALDGLVSNTGVERYSHLAAHHLDYIKSGEFTGILSPDKMIFLITRSSQSRLRIGMAARTRIFRSGVWEEDAKVSVSASEGYVEATIPVEISRGEPIRVEKICTLYTSRDKAISEAGLAAREALDRCRDIAPLLQTHLRAWSNYWERCDIILHPSLHEEQQILRLHIFHLMQTASNHTLDLDVGVPARGWTGESYRGHVFWDELFILPFLSFRLPIVSRALLEYRYLRLGRARLNAQLEGHRGAMFPWQSGSDGREESKPEHYTPSTGKWAPDNSRRHRHVNLTVAWNVWNYFVVSGDRRWMGLRGAEIIVLIARFFASLATYNAAEDRYDIDGVLGPDMYHHGHPDAPHSGVKNNAYTNVMVAWLMDTVLTVLDVIDDIYLRELMAKLDIQKEEIETWTDMSLKMSVPFFENGIINQFEGFEDLDEIDLDAYRAKYGDVYRLDRILEGEGKNANHYKVCRQADVLMLYYLFTESELSALLFRLGYDFTEDHYRRTLDYYMARTTHGTTLSHLVHTWILVRNNDPRAWDMMQTALKADLTDIIGGTTREGIHLGMMSGTADMFQRGFTGARICDGILNLDPVLQDRIKQLKCKLRFHGNWLEIDLNQERICINADSAWSEPVTICVRGECRKLSPGSTLIFKL
ncbi:MAG: glycoside hydrolase family 65 protein [Rhodospirillaceae bacterium]|nr:glycoside hydrolase family 65 protein [Rhodospirillaceae bacterium]